MTAREQLIKVCREAANCLDSVAYHFGSPAAVRQQAADIAGRCRLALASAEAEDDADPLAPVIGGEAG